MASDNVRNGSLAVIGLCPHSARSGPPVERSNYRNARWKCQGYGVSDVRFLSGLLILYFIQYRRRKQGTARFCRRTAVPVKPQPSHLGAESCSLKHVIPNELAQSGHRHPRLHDCLRLSRWLLARLAKRAVGIREHEFPAEFRQKFSNRSNVKVLEALRENEWTWPSGSRKCASLLL